MKVINELIENRNMKNTLIYLLVLHVITFIMIGCDDSDRSQILRLPSEDEFNLKSDSEIILLDKDNPNKDAFTLSWDNLIYGTSTPVTYTVQLDSINGDFSTAIENVVSAGIQKYVYTDSTLNTKALKLNLKPNIASPLKIRLKSNLAFGKMVAYSKPITITVTPYSILSLLYPMPEVLYLQGDALPSNWAYPIPDEQKMIILDEKTFGIVINMNGGKEFNLLTDNNAWTDPSYRAKTADEPLGNGDFAPFGSATNWGGFGIRTPNETAPYRLFVDFETGKYTLTASKTIENVPDVLYVQGDAVSSNWEYPIPATQKFEKINEHMFRLKIALIGGKKIDFISSATAWTDPAYKAASAEEPNMGLMVASGSQTNPAWGGNDIIIPETGNYTITVNFATGSYLIMKEK